jgi:prolyl-tRNA editing enzyme YbaK/EbsC (Cys-tRNA(Pro) deacylase)
MKPATASSALKVQAVLGEGFEVLEFETSTRTAADAAAAIGCTVGQIAKSLIFRATDSDRPVLAIASGSARVDEARLSALLGEGISRADAAFVREQTGFAIGGVPPVGHRREAVIFIDETLLDFETIWAAGGTPNAVFRLSPGDLVRLTGGEVAAIAKQGRQG